MVDIVVEQDNFVVHLVDNLVDRPLMVGHKHLVLDFVHRNYIPNAGAAVVQRSSVVDTDLEIGWMVQVHTFEVVQIVD